MQKLTPIRRLALARLEQGTAPKNGWIPEEEQPNPSALLESEPPDHEDQLAISVLEAMAVLRDLENAGIYTGPAYRAACAELLMQAEREAAEDSDSYTGPAYRAGIAKLRIGARGENETDETDETVKQPDMRPALNQNELWPTL